MVMDPWIRLRDLKLHAAMRDGRKQPETAFLRLPPPTLLKIAAAVVEQLVLLSHAAKIKSPFRGGELSRLISHHLAPRACLPQLT